MRISDWSSDVCSSDLAETRLHDAARAMEYDPDRLEATETRLFELRAMARKHGRQPDELAELVGEMAARLGAIEGGSAGLAKLEAENGRASCRERVCQYV